jgi:hypothetical protein
LQELLFGLVEALTTSEQGSSIATIVGIGNPSLEKQSSYGMSLCATELTQFIGGSNE